VQCTHAEQSGNGGIGYTPVPQEHIPGKKSIWVSFNYSVLLQQLKVFWNRWVYLPISAQSGASQLTAADENSPGYFFSSASCVCHITIPAIIPITVTRATPATVMIHRLLLRSWVLNKNKKKHESFFLPIQYITITNGFF